MDWVLGTLLCGHVRHGGRRSCPPSCPEPHRRRRCSNGLPIHVHGAGIRVFDRQPHGPVEGTDEPACLTAASRDHDNQSAREGLPKPLPESRERQKISRLLSAAPCRRRSRAAASRCHGQGERDPGRFKLTRELADEFTTALPGPPVQDRSRGDVDAGRADEQSDEAAIRRQLSELQRTSPGGDPSHIRPGDEAGDVRSLRRRERRAGRNESQFEHQWPSPNRNDRRRRFGCGRGTGDRPRRSGRLRAPGA